MGASQSLIYNESTPNYLSERITQQTKTVSTSEDGTPITRTIFDHKNKVDKLKLYFERLHKKLETTMNLHLLFDNYQVKNKAIINDLQKKLVNQDLELKNLSQDRDKIRTFIENSRSKIYTNKSKKKKLLITNIILVVVILILIFLILKKRGIL